ncbi:MAG: hypothetical protein ACRD8Z_02770 [Nitrososphaeraceae archaeon]
MIFNILWGLLDKAEEEATEEIETEGRGGDHTKAMSSTIKRIRRIKSAVADLDQWSKK